jgi:hypothetical protein
MNLLLRASIFLVLLAVVGFPAMAPPQQESTFFKDIDLDRFVEREKEVVNKVQKKVIPKPTPVRFLARMKRYPEEKQMTYVYTAMKVAGMKPIPEVTHRMFVATGEGRIIPVYVEKKAAAKLRAGLKEEGEARFLGYHVYSYEKGPAILIVDFTTR